VTVGHRWSRQWFRLQGDATRAGNVQDCANVQVNARGMRTAAGVTNIRCSGGASSHDPSHDCIPQAAVADPNRLRVRQGPCGQAQEGMDEGGLPEVVFKKIMARCECGLIITKRTFAAHKCMRVLDLTREAKPDDSLIIDLTMTE
jgi:hypothetical protein